MQYVWLHKFDSVCPAETSWISNSNFDGISELSELSDAEATYGRFKDSCQDPCVGDDTGKVSERSERALMKTSRREYSR